MELDEEQREVVESDKSMTVLDLFRNFTPDEIGIIKHVGSGSRQKEHWDSLSLREKDEKLVRSFHSDKAKEKSVEATRAKSESTRRKIGKSISAQWAGLSEEERKERNRKSGEGVSRYWENVDPRDKEGFLARTINNLESRRKVAEATQRVWDSYTPEEKRRRLANLRGPDLNRRRSRTAKANWEKLSSKEKSLRILSSIQSAHERPTMPEVLLSACLDRNFPGRLVYNGDGSQNISIGGRIPDFVEPDGGKKVISVMDGIGRYHFLDDEEAETKHYRSYGHSCLVLWDYSIYLMDGIVEKVKEFLDAS